MTAKTAKDRLIDDLKAEGFTAVGVTRADAIPEARDRLHAFLAGGLHGTMAWMAETEARRGDPLVLWPAAKSVVMVAMNYGPEDDPLEALTRRDRVTISAYARNRDYHDIVKGKLKQAAGRFAVKTGADVKVFVDTAPVMEKPLGEAAGIGWQGKHTNLVSPRPRLVVLPRRDLHRHGPARRRTGERPLRLVPELPRHLSDRCLSGALPARCAALHLVSDDRARGADPGRIPKTDGQPHLWLRRLPCRLSVEQVRRRCVGSEAESARRPEKPGDHRASRP